MKTLVLGLGNPILTDDRVGLAVAEEVRKRLNGRPDVVVEEAPVGGFRLLGLVDGYDRIIAVDAIYTGTYEPGTARMLRLSELKGCNRLDHSHGLDLVGALEVGRGLGMNLPADVQVIGIEVADPFTFGEEMTPTVAAAVPVAAHMVMEALS